MCGVPQSGFSRDMRRIRRRISESRLESAVRRFNEDVAIGDENKKLVNNFLRDAALGKTVIGKAKKKIGPARLLGYVAQLYPLILFVRKSLEDVTQEEMGPSSGKRDPERVLLLFHVVSRIVEDQHNILK